MEVTLIFGSNMGDRKAVIQEAMRLMEGDREDPQHLLFI